MKDEDERAKNGTKYEEEEEEAHNEIDYQSVPGVTRTSLKQFVGQKI